MKALQFINASNKEFIGYFNSERFSFKPNESKLLPEHLALHFADSWVTERINELIDEEKAKNPNKPETITTNNPGLRKRFSDECLKEVGVQAESEEKLKIEILNAKVEPVKETVKNDDEFEGLVETPKIKKGRKIK